MSSSKSPTSPAVASSPSQPPTVPSARQAAQSNNLNAVAARRTAQAPRMVKPTAAATRQPTTPVEEEAVFGGPTVWAAAGVGLVLLVAAAVVIKRRRSESEFDDEAFEDGLGGDNPFADLAPDANVTTPSFAAPNEATAAGAGQEANTTMTEFGDSAMMDSNEATEPVRFGEKPAPDTYASPTAQARDEATEPVPFGQPVDTGGEEPTVMTAIPDIRTPLDPPTLADSDDLPLLHGTHLPDGDAPEGGGASADTGSGSAAAAGASLPAAGAGSADIGLVLKEIERRMASIETRIDEIAEGRESIERQVAAQTEELRVQRAAIARTQRAVRNMSRPEDAAPTEPALRDPNAPSARQE